MSAANHLGCRVRRTARRDLPGRCRVRFSEAVARSAHPLLQHHSKRWTAPGNTRKAEVNEALQQWLLDIGTCLDIDHVTLRRYLIDELYLSRDANGAAYTVNPAGRSNFEFEPSIAGIDPFVVIQAARDRVAERKRQQSLRAQT